ncbi:MULTISPECIES: type II toxin-antitoxin system HipA family toxin YjjJ [Enterobacter]|uniref:Type II toxin-antitoxin system HipA family toxinoxin YjjJ n=1 Tax=Enterobacter cloacae TaxID=550 RepID=A0A4Q2E652_ENTCL|nr:MULTISPECIES: type II toxin-antitoxin system HipA family toxin YjjJ [Enterobacter]HDT2077811.1 type II toxin-antitoxin system HipA family toxin YjjJ [Enterobacter roggenkampii]HEG2002023.1 type II toxin-antitoxin system HipA family toxin YjjJ [Enterobacter asburiae]MCD2459410.1 type II toxin-antitoxin system HipA family toxin YjjJ [Enterobacter cloacae complex sp. 2021EL-01261]MCR1302047.1 type II toxin-antitoxin system HipA family toxin YjjJ [Enterobacter sp. FL1277]MCR1307192.1 type II to
MTNRSETLRQLLRKGPISVRQLTDNMGISQPTASRAIKALGDEVVRIGSGPSIHYVLRDALRGFSSAPIYRITEEGKVKPLGQLIPVYPDGFVMEQADNICLHSDGLPWWLFDMRPQGYLGRAYASRFSTELGLPANPENWTDSDVIRALLAHGHDAVGNVLIGEQARNHFVDMPQPVAVERATAYPSLALAVSSGEVPGSSAGGEQPKFCTYTERGHVIVKFTAPDDNPISERWRDLLLAEHLALKVLDVETEVFDFGGQRFLEIPRFDRVGPLGRKGLFSLRALEAEFVGRAREAWPVLVNELVKQGCVHPDAIAGTARLWAFGMLIGNTDMHHGNLSFISAHGRPYHLAPAYDMLPMGFAPKSGGGMVNTLRPAMLLDAIAGEIWHESLELAERFYALVSDCNRFSASFAPCVAALRAHLDEARPRISRLG